MNIKVKAEIQRTFAEKKRKILKLKRKREISNFQLVRLNCKSERSDSHIEY